MTTINLFRNTQEAQVFTANQYIFKEGQDGEVMYVVIAGQVDVLIGNEIIATVETGGILGEMGLVGATTRSASAIARTECKVVAINRQQFDYMVQHTPYFGNDVIQILSERLRLMNQQVAQKS